MKTLELTDTGQDFRNFVKERRQPSDDDFDQIVEEPFLGTSNGRPVVLLADPGHEWRPVLRAALNLDYIKNARSGGMKNAEARTFGFLPRVSIRNDYGRSATLTVFDGDRFSNAGVRSTVGRPETHFAVLVQPPEAVAAERRRARGTTQDPSWVAGRATKANNFAHTFDRLLVLGDGTPQQLAEQIKKWPELAQNLPSQTWE